MRVEEITKMDIRVSYAFLEIFAEAEGKELKRFENKKNGYYVGYKGRLVYAEKTWKEKKNKSLQKIKK